MTLKPFSMPETGCDSWRECVTAEFDFEQSHVYRLMTAAQIERNISPMGEKSISERTLRPITQANLQPEEQRDVWREAVETAPERKSD